MTKNIAFTFLVGASLIVSASAYANSQPICACKNGIYLKNNEWNIVKGSGGTKYLGLNDHPSLPCIGWGGVVSHLANIANKKVNNPGNVTDLTCEQYNNTDSLQSLKNGFPGQTIGPNDIQKILKGS
jgi:hypothetical protein